MRTIIFLLLSYVAAAPLTSKISMDLSKTEWDNIWTYFIWLCSFGVWFVAFAIIAFIIALASVK